MNASMDDNNVPESTIGVNWLSPGVSFVSGTTIENTPPENVLLSFSVIARGPPMEDQGIAGSPLSFLPPSSLPTQGSQKDDVELPVRNPAARIMEEKSEIPDSEDTSEISSPAKSVVGYGIGSFNTFTKTEDISVEAEEAIEVPALLVNDFKDEPLLPLIERNDIGGPPTSSALKNGEIPDSDGESVDLTSEVKIQGSLETVQATAPLDETGNQASENDTKKMGNGNTDDTDQIVLLPTSDGVKHCNLGGSPMNILEDDGDSQEDISKENKFREPLTNYRDTKSKPSKDGEEHSRQGVQLMDPIDTSQDNLLPSRFPPTNTNEVDINELPSATPRFRSSFVDEKVEALSAQTDLETAKISTDKSKDETEEENSDIEFSKSVVDVAMEDVEAQLVTSTNSVETEIAEPSETTEVVKNTKLAKEVVAGIKGGNPTDTNIKPANAPPRTSSKRRLSETEMEANNDHSTAHNSIIISEISRSATVQIDARVSEPDTTMLDNPEEGFEVPPSSASSIQEPATVADIPPEEVLKLKALPPQTKSSEPLSPPAKPASLLSSPAKASTPDVSPSKNILMAELKAIKIASIQARNASLQAELSAKKARLEEITKDLTAPAAKTVKTHIKLLHDYNDIKDIGQGLVGMIAENRGVRIRELYEEFGVSLKD
ncbi:Swi5-domain-containing protein [Tricladium varicosporioides]|nr:Swi5-domain-containing protein [Hymenoscyphus varicosporioides]